MVVASEFAKRNQLPPNIQDQILSHMCLKFKTEGLEQHETLKGLPRAIRSSIAHYLFYPIVQNVYLFHGVSQDLLLQLVLFPNPFNLHTPLQIISLMKDPIFKDRQVY